MCFLGEKTLEDGFKEYILDCKARNLREGIIYHDEETIKQIYKRIPPDSDIARWSRDILLAVSFLGKRMLAGKNACILIEFFHLSVL